MEYDPTQFTGTAAYYLRGRPPYSAELCSVLTDELGLDGTGTLVDVGAGPGTLAAELAPLVGRVVVVEPDAGMLTEARRHLADRGVEADFVHDLLEPGGAMVLVTHDPYRQPRGPLPSEPPVPHDEIRELIMRYLGDLRSGGRAVTSYVPEPFEETLARTSFGRPQVVYAAGRTDLVRHIDAVIDGVRSMSYAAPALFGDRFGDFLSELRAMLEQFSPTGRFWEWPGDTEIVIARKR